MSFHWKCTAECRCREASWGVDKIRCPAGGAGHIEPHTSATAEAISLWTGQRESDQNNHGYIRTPHRELLSCEVLKRIGLNSPHVRFSRGVEETTLVLLTIKTLSISWLDFISRTSDRIHESLKLFSALWGSLLFKVSPKPLSEPTSMFCLFKGQRLDVFFKCHDVPKWHAASSWMQPLFTPGPTLWVRTKVHHWWVQV